MLQHMTSDELPNVVNVSSVELACRKIQLLEQKVADHMPDHNDGDDTSHQSPGASFFRSNTCIPAVPIDGVAHEAVSEAAIFEEQRKAREERAPLRENDRERS